LMRIEDISEKNLDDVFKICSSNRIFAPMDDPILEKAREFKRQWLLDMLEQYGPCTKIAYLDGPKMHIKPLYRSQKKGRRSRPYEGPSG